MGVVEKIADAGVVGLGGAGFPTHMKLNADAEYFIVNGAECEPLLRTDRYLMREHADQVVAGVLAVQKELKIPHCVIALKGHYEEEVKALSKAIEKAGADIRLHLLDSYYPAGDEQSIVYEVTGRAVPPLAIPMAVGAVVDNVATVCAIADAMNDIPLTHKYLTVTGEVKEPVIVKAPVGTKLTEVTKAAGGTLREAMQIVTGGPMMGKVLSEEAYEDSVVTKTTSSVLVLPADGYHAFASSVNIRSMLHRAKSACIQCRFCTDLCPRYLLGHPMEPHKVMRQMATVQYEEGQPVPEEMLQIPEIQRAQLCCECGICETYACPMGLRPRTINSLLKQELGKRSIRCTVDKELVRAVHEARTDRLVPSEKAAARVGVAKYYDYEITKVVEITPDEIRLPLRMHIGAPSVPVVKKGDRVRAMQCVAKRAEKGPGADIHTGIEGTVKEVTEQEVVIGVG